MNKKLKIAGSALLCILGWLMGGIGFAEPLPYGLNTPFYFRYFVNAFGFRFIHSLFSKKINNYFRPF